MVIYGWFTYLGTWFCIVMLVCQRVYSALEVKVNMCDKFQSEGCNVTFQGSQGHFWFTSGKTCIGTVLPPPPCQGMQLHRQHGTRGKRLRLSAQVNPESHHLGHQVCKDGSHRSPLQPCRCLRRWAPRIRCTRWIALACSNLEAMRVTWKTKQVCGFVWKCCVPKPNGFADQFPYEKWLFHWGYTPFSDTAMYTWKYLELPWIPWIPSKEMWSELIQSSHSRLLINRGEHSRLKWFGSIFTTTTTSW